MANAFVKFYQPGPPKFTGAELAKLLRSLPKPDEEYLAFVAELISRRPSVAGWGSAVTASELLQCWTPSTASAPY
jgi:hypothetical protein